MAAPQYDVVWSGSSWRDVDQTRLGRQHEAARLTLAQVEDVVANSMVPGRWHYSPELATFLDWGIRTVINALARLERQGRIQSRDLPASNAKVYQLL